MAKNETSKINKLEKLTQQNSYFIFLKIEIVVNNMKREKINVTGDFRSFQAGVIYVGGAPNQNNIHRIIRKNFIGCLRNVTFKNDISNLNLIDMAMNDSKLIVKEGVIEKSCNKITDPITFSSPNSYIPINEWKEFPKFNSFSIEFQTTENYGVLAYILGADNTNNNNKTNKHNKITNQIQSKLSVIT